MGDPSDLTATAAAAAIRRGDITSERLVAACLDRVAKLDHGIGAFAHLDRDFALEQARAADRAKADGAHLGALHGVPVAIKDVIDTADMPTQCGSAFYAGHQPERDAACVTALRGAGAVIMGKTVTTELASLPPSAVANPVVPGHTPGGSSAGSAAAVASRMVPAALGTQTAGSVLRPAAYCGLYGFKPTLGLIPRPGVLEQSHTLDTVGVLARSLEDVALLTDVMAVHDAADAASYPRSAPGLLAAARSGPSVPPRFAFVRTPAWEEADAAMKEAITAFAAGLGGACETVDIAILERVLPWQRTVQSAENVHYYGHILDRAPDKLGPEMRRRLEDGCKVPVRAYLEAVTSVERAYAEVTRALSGFDAVLTPAAPGPAPAGLARTGDPVFNGLWTYLGMPAVTLPLLETAAGHPMGVQLVARRRADAALLQVAHWLEERAGR